MSSLLVWGGGGADGARYPPPVSPLSEATRGDRGRESSRCAPRNMCTRYHKTVTDVTNDTDPAAYASRVRNNHRCGGGCVAGAGFEPATSRL